MKEIHRELMSWKMNHEECRRIMERLGKSKSKLSYLHSDGVQKATQLTSISSSRIQVRVLDEMEEDLTALTSLQNNMMASLLRMEDALKAIPAAGVFSVCPRLLSGVVEQLRQQTQLESSLKDRLFSLEASDQDSLLTLLACFSYTPYVNNADLESILKCRESSS